MDTAKYLLDSGQCGVNDIEPDDLLTPLHIAASWDNLLMCQLLVHYGADLLAMNRDKCTPCDMAKGKSKDFLRKMMKRGEKRRKRKLFKYLRLACFLKLLILYL
jgi:ankyrin repeat protein